MYPILLSALLSVLICAGCGPEHDPAAPEKKATVETYKYASSIPVSKRYIVYVNGEEQKVYPTDEAHICTFGCDGEVTVRVLALKGADGAVLRPLAKNYTFTQTDVQTIEFKAAPYDRIVAEFGGSEEAQLFLFVNPLSEKPSRDDPDVMFFEAGTVHTTTHLKVPSGKTLYLEGGAVLKAKVYIEGSTGVRIAGGGILDTWSNETEVNSLRIQKSSDIKVSDIVILGDGGRVIFNEESSNVVLDNVKAIGRANGDQCDAIDLYGCHDYAVTRCFAYGNDDTYCIKSWKYNYKGESYNIRFEDCIARNFRGNSFEIGYETGLDIHDVSYKDIYSIHSSGGSENLLRRGAVTIHNGAAGHIYDIFYEDVWIEDPLEFGIDLRILKSGYQLGTGEEWAPGKTDGIRMKNVHILKQAPQGHTVAGYDSTHQISVEFENLTIGGEHILSSAQGKFSVTNANVSFK